MKILKQKITMTIVHKTTFVPTKIASVIMFFLSLGSIQHARAEDAIQFNTDVLDVKDRASIDLTQFSRAGYLMPGTYQFTIRLNSSELPDETVEYIVSKNDPKDSVACLTPKLVDKFGLTNSSLKKATWWNDGKCLELSSLEGILVRPDLGSNTLYINMPQAYLEYTAENWDPPSRWDNGVAGILFDYNINAMNSHQSSGGSSKSLSGNGTAGVNAGPWRLRADWQAQYTKNEGDNTGAQKSLDWNRYYAYRAISSLKSKLSVGENYLDSSIFDSFRFDGASLSTDDSQLPPNVRGYAPEVSGVAKTNAKVTVSQQGRVIYETTVAAGPFHIQDLSSAISGKLDVKVEEQDGSVQNFQVDTASVPYLTRPGQIRYKISGGKPSDYDHHTEGPNFITNEFSWGINNNWSLYGGALLAGDYNALSVGIGRDLLMFGAISLDVTQSSAELPGESKQVGKSIRVSYSKRFDDYDSQVTFAGYRFSEREFMSMSQYLDKRYHDDNNSENDKELYTITFNKQFRPINTSIYLNYSHQTYWGSPATNTWNISMSNYFDIGSLKNVSVNLSAYRSKYDGENDDGMYLSLTLPWGNGGSVSYNGQSSNGESSNSVGFYDRIDAQNNYQLSAGTTSEGDATGSGYFSHEGDLANVTANASITGSDYRAYGLSLQGGITATTHGVALHRINALGGTRMMLDTDGVSDVPVKGNGNVTHTNMFGKAVVSDISKYYRNSLNVDLDALPENVDATRSVVQATLTEGAIGYRKFGILAGQKAMAVIKLADGTSPPFGAEVHNNSGIQTGIVGDDGNVWLSGIQPKESMDVSWNDGVECRVDLPPSLPTLDKNILLPCRLLKTSEQTQAK